MKKTSGQDPRRSPAHPDSPSTSQPIACCRRGRDIYHLQLHSPLFTVLWGSLVILAGHGAIARGQRLIISVLLRVLYLCRLRRASML